MENWKHSLKDEALHGERFRSRSEAKHQVFEYIEVYYNGKWLHSKLGYPSPEPFKAKKSLNGVLVKSGQDHCFKAENEDKLTPFNIDGYLPIALEPADPDDFKKALLHSKHADIETTYKDGKVERKSWNASKFIISSNVFGKLRSRPEFRSGNWQKMGIVKVHAMVINA